MSLSSVCRTNNKGNVVGKERVGYIFGDLYGRLGFEMGMFIRDVFVCLFVRSSFGVEHARTFLSSVLWCILLSQIIAFVSLIS